MKKKKPHYLIGYYYKLINNINIPVLCFFYRKVCFYMDNLCFEKQTNKTRLCKWIEFFKKGMDEKNKILTSCSISMIKMPFGFEEAAYISNKLEKLLWDAELS